MLVQANVNDRSSIIEFNIKISIRNKELEASFNNDNTKVYFDLYRFTEK